MERRIKGSYKGETIVPLIESRECLTKAPRIRFKMNYEKCFSCSQRDNCDARENLKYLEELGKTNFEEEE